MPIRIVPTGKRGGQRSMYPGRAKWSAKGKPSAKKHPVKRATGGRTGKQFGGGFNQPLGGVRAPVRPLGFKHGKSANKK